MTAKKAETSKKSKSAVVTQQAEESVFSPARINHFINDVKSEFGKIVWPDKKHTVASTGVVVVLVMMISFYLGAVDLVLGKLVGYILR